jgi:hypothetical protein
MSLCQVLSLIFLLASGFRFLPSPFLLASGFWLLALLPFLPGRRGEGRGCRSRLRGRVGSRRDDLVGGREVRRCSRRRNQLGGRRLEEEGAALPLVRIDFHQGAIDQPAFDDLGVDRWLEEFPVDPERPRVLFDGCIVLSEAFEQQPLLEAGRGVSGLRSSVSSRARSARREGKPEARREDKPEARSQKPEARRKGEARSRKPEARRKIKNNIDEASLTMGGSLR